MPEILSSIFGSQIFYNAVIAIATIAYTVGTFVLVSESRKQRKAQLRPQVDMYAEPLGGLIFYATVQNVGNNPAKNIKVTFSVSDKSKIETRYMKELYDKFANVDIPHLSPGKKYRYLIRSDADDFNVDQTITAKLTFKDIEDTHYESEVDWNMSRLKNSIVNDEVRDFYKDVPKRLKEIRDILKKS